MIPAPEPIPYAYRPRVASILGHRCHVWPSGAVDVLASHRGTTWVRLWFDPRLLRLCLSGWCVTIGETSRDATPADVLALLRSIPPAQ